MSIQSLPPICYLDFHTASQEVLEFLHARLGFQLWMVTRTEGDDWIVLNAVDHGYGVESGNIFNWMDSYCSRMVEGLGPRIAPRSDEIWAYAEAPIGRQVPIAAYVGVPMAQKDGSLFGTLCAIDPKPQPDTIIEEQPLIETLAGLLATVLKLETQLQSISREAEKARLDSMTDSLTRVFNRRAWDKLLTAEEARCKRYGHTACVFSIDVDGLKLVNDEFGHAAGDQMLIDVSSSIRHVVRESDFVARLGGDEFAILAVECDPQSAESIKERLQKLLIRKSISVSVGYSIRRARDTLAQSMIDADKQMYMEKRSR